MMTSTRRRSKHNLSHRSTKDRSATPHATDRSVPSRQNSKTWETASPVADTYSSVNDYFIANEDAFVPRSRNIADPDADAGDIEVSLSGYAESAKILIKGLMALGQLHPCIAVAVAAFATVVTMDLARRDNDRKMQAVKVQMRDMMVALIELRHIPSSAVVGPDGITVEVRLASLMYEIERDIKRFGAACDSYSKKHILAKTVKALKYEAHFASYAETFVEHRRTLQLKLAIHVSKGIDAANQKLDDQDDRLRVIEEKLDMIAMFRKLDTPREKDLQKFIEEHGGAKACVASDELLEELVARSGESLSRFPGRESGRRSNDLPDIRKRLLKEMQEDIEEAFTKNMVLFERKLDIQSKQLTDVVVEESEHIISTILSGAHDRITDPDLREIWKDMGWKGSVKARTFVLALHDYYSDKRSLADSPRASQIRRQSPPQTPGSRKGSMLLPSKTQQDDGWALAYINAAYVQPILEAVDDDGTGFVSVKEVNTFVAERPENWSLPHWIAYWAAGWQASMSRYKDKIYELVQIMFRILEHVLPSNRRAVDEYLFHSSFWRIELLLRSTRSVGSKILSDTDLSKLTEAYEKDEEERLETSLESVNYEIDTPETVSLITGVGRIERVRPIHTLNQETKVRSLSYVFPLVYLLLRRHMKVMKLACKHVLDTEEFVSLNDSLVSILLAIDDRLRNLEAIFKQTHLDVQARLGNFAFGIFQLSYGDIRRVPADNSYASWTHPDGDSNVGSKIAISPDEAKSLAAGIPHDILKYGIQDGYSVTDYYEFEKLGLTVDTSSIEGTWTGHCRRQYGDESISCVLRISMRLSEASKIIGKGEDFSGAFEFSGDISDIKRSPLEFVFVVSDQKDGTSRTCTGTLDQTSATITARWKTVRGDDVQGDGLEEPFTLRRTPPALLRYRYTPAHFAEDPVRSRWSFACSAALHLAQERMWSRRFFEARFKERSTYVELTTRALIVQLRLTPQVPLTPVEKGTLEYLRQRLDPSEARFYQALAEFEIQKLPWHPAWGCDSCGRQITKSRILCLHCISEDLSDNFDLCTSCLDKAPTTRTFTHDVTHPVIKVEQTLHDYDTVRIVNAARTTFERVKALFRSLESAHPRLDDERKVVSRKDGLQSNPNCVFCRKNIWPGCWVCVVCTKDTFVCADCDLKGPSADYDPKGFRNTTPQEHTQAHALVRIHEASIKGESATSEDKLLGLEKQLLTMESKFADSLATLEATVQERLSALETKVESRLSKLEDILRQIAAQTAVQAALNGQIMQG